MKFFIGGFNSGFEGDEFGGFDQIDNLCCFGGIEGSRWYGGIQIGDFVFPKKDAKIKALWRLKEYGSVNLHGKLEQAAKFEMVLEFDEPISLDEFTRFKYFELDINLLNKTKKFVRGCGFHEIKYTGPNDILNNLNIFDFKKNSRDFFITLEGKKVELKERDINIIIKNDENLEINGIYEVLNGTLESHNSFSNLYNEKNKNKYSLKELLKMNSKRLNKRNYLSKIIVS